jgi:hypothetical protein
MATSALCGSTGSITGVTEITAWDITLNVDTPEATSMASEGWKERVPCLRGGSGSMKTIVKKITGPYNGVAFKSSASGGITVTGNIIVNKCTPNTPVDGIITYTSDFIFTGSITASSLI